MEVQVDLQKFLEDYKAAMHVDKNNLGPSYIIGLGDSSIFIDSSVFFYQTFVAVEGDYSGGWLWLDDGSKLGRAKNIRSPHGMDASGRKWTQVNEFEDVHI